MEDGGAAPASTKNRILDAAVDVLVDRGLEGFTTPAVAAAAGVAQGTIFRHFATKKDLIAATTAAAIEATMADTARSFAVTMRERRPATGAEIVRLTVEALRDAYFDDRIAAANEVRSRSRTDPDLRTALLPVLAAADITGADHVGLLVPESFRSSADDFRTVAKLVTSALQGRAMARISLPDPAADDELVESLVELAVTRLATPSTSTPGPPA